MGGWVQVGEAEAGKLAPCRIQHRLKRHVHGRGLRQEWNARQVSQNRTSLSGCTWGGDRKSVSGRTFIAKAGTSGKRRSPWSGYEANGSSRCPPSVSLSFAFFELKSSSRIRIDQWCRDCWRPTRLSETLLHCTGG